MPSRMKKDALARVTILPPGSKQEAKQLVLVERIESLKFFNKMKEREREELVDETRQFGQALMAHGMAGVAMGAHLDKIKKLIGPYNGWTKFCKNFNIPVRNADRMIDGYLNAAKTFPEPILRGLAARGVKIVGYDDSKPLGVLTDIVKKLPPPRNPSPEKVNEYLDELDEKVKEKRARARKAANKGQVVEAEPETLLRSAYRSCNGAFRRLPNNTRTRRKWLDDLIGYLLADFGLSNPQSFSPHAVPEDFRPNPVGRPSIVKKNPESEKTNSATA
jgi:hypothetical protein